MRKVDPEAIRLGLLLLCETLLELFKDLGPAIPWKRRRKYEEIAAGLKKIREELGGGQ